MSIAEWLLKKTEPYALHFLDWVTERVARANETPSERHARREAERMAWEVNSGWYRARHLWNRAPEGQREMWLRRSSIAISWANEYWEDLLPYQRDRLMPIVTKRF